MELAMVSNLDWGPRRALLLKCLLYVFRKIGETPASLSNSIRREVPFNSTDLSILFPSVVRLYREKKNGSTES